MCLYCHQVIEVAAKCRVLIDGMTSCNAIELAGMARAARWNLCALETERTTLIHGNDWATFGLGDHAGIVAIHLSFHLLDMRQAFGHQQRCLTVLSYMNAMTGYLPRIEVDKDLHHALEGTKSAGGLGRPGENLEERQPIEQSVVLLQARCRIRQNLLPLEG